MCEPRRAKWQDRLKWGAVLRIAAHQVVAAWQVVQGCRILRATLGEATLLEGPQAPDLFVRLQVCAEVVLPVAEQCAPAVEADEGRLVADEP